MLGPLLFCTRFFVTLTSSKLLAFRKAQIYLAFHSFFRNFVALYFDKSNQRIYNEIKMHVDAADGTGGSQQLWREEE